MGDREGRLLILLCGVALALRIVIAGFTNVVSHDGAAYYLPLAAAIARGDWDAGLSANIPVLYPLLSGLMGRFVGDVEIGGLVVSVLAGTLTIVPVYLLGRGIGGIRVGRIAAILAVVSPLVVRYAAMAQGDALYALFFLVAVWIGMSLVRRPSPLLGATAGAMTGAAYLVRPESMGLFAMVGAFLLWGIIKKRVRPVPSGMALGAMALAFIILASPQIWITHCKTGVWTLSAKAGAVMQYGKDPRFGMAALGEEGDRTVWEEAFGKEGQYIRFSPVRMILDDPVEFARRYTRSLWVMLSYVPVDMGGATFGIAVLAMAMHFHRRRRGEGYLGTTILFYVLALPVFYTSRAMWVPLMPIVVALAARRIRLLPRWATWLCLAVLLTLPQTGRPIAKYGWTWWHGPEKAAGEALREMAPANIRVLGHHGRIALYAGGTHVPLPVGPPDQVVRFARKRGAGYLAFEDRWLQRRRPEVHALVHGGTLFEVIIVQTGSGREIVVARLLPEKGEKP